MKISRSLLTILIISAGCLLFAYLASTVTLHCKDEFTGFYVLRGSHGHRYEITDDLFPEDLKCLVKKLPLSIFRRVDSGTLSGNGSTLSYEWNSATGRGFIKNSFSDGRKLVFCLGRFKDSSGTPVKGLFLGGNLPVGDPDHQFGNANETGMSYFDGSAFFHIWCNANEAIVPVSDLSHPVYPSMWQFADSRAVVTARRELLLKSRHRAVVGGTPLSIERTLTYRPGDTFFILKTHIINIGANPTSFEYFYGDEPWLGNYGSSCGNVGWTAERLVYTELMADTSRTKFIGMFDGGNPLAGETGSAYTRMANFIEWESGSRPDSAFFSNRCALPSDSGRKPLNSPDNRFVGMLWGPRMLAPGESMAIILAVGMASDRNLPLPVKPETGLR